MEYALITGASKGIGKEIALQLAKKNIHLILIARSENELKEISIYLTKTYKIHVDYLALDLSILENIPLLYNWVEEKKYIVKYLINNAGYGISGKFEDTNLASYNNMMHLNMQQLVMLTYLFLPNLKKLHSKAYIMNIASAAAYQAVPGLTVYAATKAFVLSFSRGLSAELEGTNVCVCAISPGGTNTHFAERANVHSSYAIKMGKKLNMEASMVAKLAIESMFKEKKENIIGWVNKLGAFLAWLLPKKIVENSTKKIYLFKD